MPQRKKKISLCGNCVVFIILLFAQAHPVQVINAKCIAKQIIAKCLESASIHLNITGILLRKCVFHCQRAKKNRRMTVAVAGLIKISCEADIWVLTAFDLNWCVYLLMF